MKNTDMYKTCKFYGIDGWYTDMCSCKEIVKEHPFVNDCERACYGQPICMDNVKCDFYKKRDEE